MEKKPLFVSTPRGDKSLFESLPHTENYETAKMYRYAMCSTPKVEKLLKQRRKQNEENLTFNPDIVHRRLLK